MGETTTATGSWEVDENSGIRTLDQTGKDPGLTLSQSLVNRSPPVNLLFSTFPLA